MMFEWFVNDRMSSGEIAKKLTTMGIPTRTGKKEWNRATVKDILKNNLYTGKIRWNRRKVGKELIEGTLKKTKRRRLSEEYLIVEGKHPALISQEMFDKPKRFLSDKSP